MKYVNPNEYARKLRNSNGKYNKSHCYFKSWDIKVIHGYGTDVYPYIHLLFDRYFNNERINIQE